MSGEAGKVGTPPEHYKTDSGIDPFAVIDAYGLDFYLGNAFKYMVRATRKGDYEGDLRKARHYLQEALLRASNGTPWWHWPTPPAHLNVLAVQEAFGLSGLEASVVRDILVSQQDDETRFWLRGAEKRLGELIDTF